MSSISSKKKIILASGSPRRSELLKQIGLEFDVRENGVSETIDAGLSPEENVRLLARRKAIAVAETVREGIVVGADTVVVLGDRILGKPRDAEEARTMLKLLSGKEHFVYTAFTIVEKTGGRSLTDHEVTMVKFRQLSDEEIDEYVNSGTALDKAGAYGIQEDRGAIFVERINGCFYNVAGLPLTKFYTSLKTFLEHSDG